MKKSVFDYRDYKRYLNDFIRSQRGGGHGSRSKIANALHCQVAYVSQVLNRSAHFSLEQGEELNSYLGHDKDESQYFLFLIQLARAGTQKLKARLNEQIEKILERRTLLRERIDIKQRLSEHDQMKYYSAWYYAAMHILVTIPEFQTKSAISSRLNLDMETVTEALSFLLSTGLVNQNGNQFTPGLSRLFLGSDSPMISKHHTNWRMRAIDSLDRPGDRDLHYSVVVSISKSDVSQIKESLIKAIDQTRATIKESKEEDLHCLNLDFFQV